jgi:hypothetical protein
MHTPFKEKQFTKDWKYIYIYCTEYKKCIGFKAYSTHLNERNIQANICPDFNACWNVESVRVISTVEAARSSHAFQHNFQSFSLRGAHSADISGFIRISWQAFSIHCGNISKPLIGAEYTKVFSCTCSHTIQSIRVSWLWMPVHWTPLQKAPFRKPKVKNDSKLIC